MKQSSEDKLCILLSHLMILRKCIKDIPQEDREDYFDDAVDHATSLLLSVLVEEASRDIGLSKK